MASEQYKNKIIIAPMVRVGTLPFRLLAMDYGADLVYTQEIIDFRMLRAVKKDNRALGTTDFVDKSDGTIVWRTCTKETNKVIFQIGTNDPQRALKVTKMVEPYVAGVDINMGCPKTFSLKGGMGAALLTKPDKIKAILTTLVEGASIPITCKIRILPSMDDTLKLCRMIQGCGVAAIAVHGRTKDERPNDANHNDYINRIASELDIPVIANGGSKEVMCYEDIQKFRNVTGASSVMLARAAMWNCSIVRKEGMLPMDTVIESYLRYCIDYDNIFTYSKYTVQNILRNLQETPRGKAFLETQTLQEICVLWGLGDYFNTIQTQHEALKETQILENHKASMPASMDCVQIHTRTDENGVKVVEAGTQFIRGNFCNADLPKMVLNNYVYKNEIDTYVYSCTVEDRFFRGSVEVGDTKYSSTVKEKSRRYAEQGAAMVCLHALKLVDKFYGFVPAEGARKHKITPVNVTNRQKENINEVETSKKQNSVREKCENDNKKFCTENDVNSRESSVTRMDTNSVDSMDQNNLNANSNGIMGQDTNQLCHNGNEVNS